MYGDVETTSFVVNGEVVRSKIDFEVFIFDP